MLDFGVVLEEEWAALTPPEALAIHRDREGRRAGDLPVADVDVPVSLVRYLPCLPCVAAGAVASLLQPDPEPLDVAWRRRVGHWAAYNPLSPAAQGSRATLCPSWERPEDRECLTVCASCVCLGLPLAPYAYWQRRRIMGRYSMDGGRAEAMKAWRWPCGAILQHLFFLRRQQRFHRLRYDWEGGATRDSGERADLPSLKVVICGPSGPARSTLLANFLLHSPPGCADRDAERGLQEGVSMGMRTVCLDELPPAAVTFWNVPHATAADLRDLYLGGADGAFLPFRHDDHASFEGAMRWLEEARRFSGERLPATLVCMGGGGPDECIFMDEVRRAARKRNVAVSSVREGGFGANATLKRLLARLLLAGRDCPDPDPPPECTPAPPGHGAQIYADN